MPTAPPSPLLLWDLFCQVIDNHGDLGVCWRLATQLAARGQRVRLWVDDARALAWMAPGAVEGHLAGIQVLPWTRPFHAGMPPEAMAQLPRADVWIEAFGCEIASEFIAFQRHSTLGNGQNRSTDPVWINLEYLSAEPYVERCHGLPSPVMHGPGQGLTRHFFYPGFTPRTGGLLREPDLAARQAAFDRAGWLAGLGVQAGGERLLSLFCYEPPALAPWLAHLAADATPTRLLVTHGRAAEAVNSIFKNENGHIPSSMGHSSLSISYLPALTQVDYDHLLWACDLNFVRGEDSLVRALWAGRPLIWQIYPQDDGAHHAKLEAFLDWLDAPASLRQFHRTWNGIADTAGARSPSTPELNAWAACARAARARLFTQDDLATQLLGFVGKKR
ncbi:MAG: elongation factor P maturation arginine rhamnosyltransferase EarP [Comamonadaceae bacterium]|nr:elongation factor P maturation arginine rhamnosyltransferase EarP [Comamonadaceae bacterium]